MADPVEARFEQALAAQEAGQLALAAGLYADLLQRRPDDARVANNLGNVMLALGHGAEARACFAQALAVAPESLEARYNLARLDQIDGRFADALAGYDRVLATSRLEPAAYNRAIVLGQLGQTDAAVDAYRALLAWAPEHLAAWNNLGKALRERGETAEAVGAFAAARRLAPGDAEIASNHLFCLLHDPATTPEALRAAQDDYAARFAPRVPPRPVAQSRAGVLRLGFVSGDLRDHPVGRFLLPLLEHLDRSRCVALAFSNAEVDDPWSARLRQACAEWHAIGSLDDEAAAKLVAGRGVDVLIDLAGHTAGNRLGIFVRRPAPVQATWLGYLGSTGLPAIDWRISDRRADPPENAAIHAERLAWLTHGAWCYRPPLELPLPCFGEKEGLLLGAFSGASKLSDRVLGLWARILRDNAQARLLLAGIPEGRARERVAGHLQAGGVDGERFSFLPRLPIREYLEHLGKVDIALDSWPYVGATTTCDALWMGVPVVSLGGWRSASGSGRSLLATVGLDDWFAEDADRYVEIVARWAAAPRQLAELKAGLRERMRRSPLMDEAAFAEDFMEMIRALWQDARGETIYD